MPPNARAYGRAAGWRALCPAKGVTDKARPRNSRCYAALSGFMRETSFLMACAVPQRSATGGAFSQNSGVLPKSRACSEWVAPAERGKGHQKLEPGCLRNSISSSEDTRPQTWLRCG